MIVPLLVSVMCSTPGTPIWVASGISWATRARRRPQNLADQRGGQTGRRRALHELAPVDLAEVQLSRSGSQSTLVPSAVPPSKSWCSASGAAARAALPVRFARRQIADIGPRAAPGTHTPCVGRAHDFVVLGHLVKSGILARENSSGTKGCQIPVGGDEVVRATGRKCGFRSTIVDWRLRPVARPTIAAGRRRRAGAVRRRPRWCEGRHETDRWHGPLHR